MQDDILIKRVFPNANLYAIYEIALHIQACINFPTLNALVTKLLQAIKTSLDGVRWCSQTRSSQTNRSSQTKSKISTLAWRRFTERKVYSDYMSIDHLTIRNSLVSRMYLPIQVATL